MTCSSSTASISIPWRKPTACRSTCNISRIGQNIFKSLNRRAERSWDTVSEYSRQFSSTTMPSFHFSHGKSWRTWRNLARARYSFDRLPRLPTTGPCCHPDEVPRGCVREETLLLRRSLRSCQQQDCHQHVSSSGLHRVSNGPRVLFWGRRRVRHEKGAEEGCREEVDDSAKITCKTRRYRLGKNGKWIKDHHSCSPPWVFVYIF